MGYHHYNGTVHRSFEGALQSLADLFRSVNAVVMKTG